MSGDANLSIWFRLGICLSLVVVVGGGCFLLEEDADDEEDGGQEVEPVRPVENGGGTSAAPAAGGEPAPVAAPLPPAPAGLSGPYELQWIDGANGRQPMPANLLQRMPGCLWGRWLWQFGPLGELTVHNELLCEDSELGMGICRAEFETRVVWQQNAFVVPAPIQARSQFVNLRPQGESWAAAGGAHNTTSIGCNVNLRSVTATMTDVVPGATPARPQAVTLDFGTGERVRLSATQLEVDYAQIIMQQAAPGSVSAPAEGAPPAAAPQIGTATTTSP